MHFRESHFSKRPHQSQYPYPNNLTTLGVLTLLTMLTGGCTVGAMSSALESQSVPSAKQAIIQQEPSLENNTLALAGLKVRSGDVIDAITPIFAEVTPDKQIANTREGVPMGGTGGEEVVLLHEGYLITGINVEYGDYFGASELVHLEIIWSQLTPDGLDPNNIITSEKLGSGNFANIFHREELRAEQGTYISGIFSRTSPHTSGESFVNHLAIEVSPLSN